jgi:hypothetical protein
MDQPVYLVVLILPARNMPKLGEFRGRSCRSDTGVHRSIKPGRRVGRNMCPLYGMVKLMGLDFSLDSASVSITWQAPYMVSISKITRFRQSNQLFRFI